MSRPLLRALIVALLAASALGGCGIPDNSAVVTVGPGPPRGATSGEGQGPTKHLRNDTADRATFVKNFLTAAAGDYDSATDEVKRFMAPDYAATFKPSSTDLKVIRLTSSPLINPGNPVVTFTAKQIGTLNNFGVLTPSADDHPVQYKFTLGQVAGQPGWFITDGPKWLLLSDTALSNFYTKRTIYFWNNDHTGLIPDVRYMSLTVPPEQQPTEVLDWLTGGPADWLAGVAEKLPDGTKLIGNVPAVNDRLQINLSSQALPPDDPTALFRLQNQLRWSLRPNLQTAALELNVEHQPEQVYRDNDYLSSNAAYRTTTQPERFVVYDGQIRRLSRSNNATEAVPLLTPAANRNIRMAAFSATAKRTYAALVVNDGAGGETLRVGSAPTGQQTTLTAVRLPIPMGRPVWALSPPVNKADGTVGLVTAKGRLYGFAPDGSSVRAVTMLGGLNGISAVAVAPDARRVALLSGGRLYLAMLSNDDGLRLSEPILIQTVMADLTAVDWSGEATLVVSGTKPETGRMALMDVSIDGASQTDRLADLGNNPVTYLTAYPADPAGNQDAEVPVAYVLAGFAYDEESSLEKIGVGQLTPPVTSPRTGVQPTAPFFLN